MTREYSSRRPARRGKSGAHQFLVLIVTFLFGYLMASFFDIEAVSHWMNTQVLANNEKQQQPAKQEPQHSQLPPKPKFEFYTLLANEKGASSSTANKHSAPPNTAKTSVPVTSVQNAAVASAAAAAGRQNIANTARLNAVKIAEGRPLAAKPVNKGAYSVQVASFKARADAEHMKGLLILKGFNVAVVPVSQAQGNWFRVIVGPYPNRELALRAQAILAKTERLNGMVRSAGG